MKDIHDFPVLEHAAIVDIILLEDLVDVGGVWVEPVEHANDALALCRLHRVRLPVYRCWRLVGCAKSVVVIVVGVGGGRLGVVVVGLGIKRGTIVACGCLGCGLAASELIDIYIAGAEPVQLACALVVKQVVGILEIRGI